jgi:hypothetical protein
MLFLMKISVATGVPILPVHDEIVFPEPYLDDMKYCLAASWRLALQGAGSFGNLPLKISSVCDDKLSESETLINLHESNQ